jgi:hypothetical protein
LCARERIRKPDDNDDGDSGKGDAGEFHGRSLRMKKDNSAEKQRFRALR